ncbi:MAG: 50S ribosomal protein L23 [Planctomycetes bacterium]|nr:50S ribosomal protein L23 [Planctomycetota bacterium]
MAEQADHKVSSKFLEKSFRVVYAPIITEKSVQPRGPKERDEEGNIIGENRPTFAFWVNMNANKFEIKAAIEEIFKVKVERVRIIVQKGRRYRSRWIRKTRAPRKKAIVTLKDGETIDLA